jgi:hypothetical protein
MPAWLASLLAALIGAAAGSIGAVITSDWRKRKAETSERREAFVQRYLFQLQDAAETLWYRLDNVSRRGGRLVMDDAYFETTTLYALGRVLAIERLLALEGAYPQLERLYPGLGEFLMQHRIDYELTGSWVLPVRQHHTCGGSPRKRGRSVSYEHLPGVPQAL